MIYQFEKATLQDVNEVFELVKQRVVWMDEVGIHQWNETDYLNAYPLEYYLQQAKLNQLYVLKDNEHIVGAIVCLQEDTRWQDQQPAYYLHNFVSMIGVKGVGSIILKEVEKLAKSNHKIRLRLDCAIDNQKLNDYYESHGFYYAGECQDGPYIGNKREKVIE